MTNPNDWPEGVKWLVLITLVLSINQYSQRRWAIVLKVTAMLVLLGLVLLSSGCATHSTTTVKIPVPVLCTTDEPLEPNWSAPSMVGRTAYEQMRSLLSDRVLARAYEQELRTALRSCKE